MLNIFFRRPVSVKNIVLIFFGRVQCRPQTTGILVSSVNSRQERGSAFFQLYGSFTMRGHLLGETINILGFKCQLLLIQFFLVLQCAYLVNGLV